MLPKFDLLIFQCFLINGNIKMVVTNQGGGPFNLEGDLSQAAVSSGVRKFIDMLL